MILKNIELSKVLELKNQVMYLPGQIVSKTLVQNQAVSITLFAFDAGEEISSHESSGDAFITVLDGKGLITIADTSYEVTTGESIIMPAGIPHAVASHEPFKMMLTVVFA